MFLWTILLVLPNKIFSLLIFLQKFAHLLRLFAEVLIRKRIY